MYATFSAPPLNLIGPEDVRDLSELSAIPIVKIAGRVRGAGSEFALACDMRFASLERGIFGCSSSSWCPRPCRAAHERCSPVASRRAAMSS